MESFTGTKRLIRLALRRDRFTVPAVLILAIMMIAGSVPTLATTYASPDTISSYVASSAVSVVGRIFQGTVAGPNLGSIIMAETFVVGSVILAIMSIFIVSRHTRYNEEIGAGELIGSAQVGRNAPLSAALFVAVTANLTGALIIFASLSSTKELGTTGSLFFGLALAFVGIFFAAVSAVTVQLSDYRRGANGMAIAALGGFFMVRGIGDSLGTVSADGLSVEASWLTWLSPMGWGYQVLPFSNNRVFPLVLLMFGSIAVSWFAYYLLSRRDVGSSIFEARPGPQRAKQSLLSASGLALRLQKVNLLAWTAGFAAMGGLNAVILNDYRKTIEENEVFAEWLGVGAGNADDFLSTIIANMFPLFAAMFSGYVVASLSKMRDEETSGRAEHLLGTAVGKIRWMFSHVGITIFGIFLTLFAMGLAGGVGYEIVAGSESLSALDIIVTSLLSVPAMLLFMSTIVLAFAVASKHMKVFAWSFYAYSALIGSMASIFKWPQWISNFSPFGHTPLYSEANLQVAPLLIMTGLSIVLLAVATALFNRRDIVAT